VVWKAAKDGVWNLNTLLEDGKTRTRSWNAARWWRNANSWLKDLKTLLERTRNTSRRRNATSCSQDLNALLEELVVTEWHLPDSTVLAYLLKYYPRPPCAPSLIKSRFFSHTIIFLLTPLHFWNSLYVYTRGILGASSGFGRLFIGLQARELFFKSLNGLNRSLFSTVGIYTLLNFIATVRKHL